MEAERLAAEGARYEAERVEKERERAAAEEAARAEAERQAAETVAKAKGAEAAGGAAREDNARPASIMCEAEIKAPINRGRDTTAMAPAGTAQKGWKERLKRQPKGSWMGQDESQFYANLPVLITALVDRDVQESATTLPLTKGESVAVIRTDYCPAGQWVVRLGSGATGLVDTASLPMTADVLKAALHVGAADHDGPAAGVDEGAARPLSYNYDYENDQDDFSDSDAEDEAAQQQKRDNRMSTANDLWDAVAWEMDEHGNTRRSMARR